VAFGAQKEVFVKKRGPYTPREVYRSGQEDYAQNYYFWTDLKVTSTVTVDFDQDVLPMLKTGRFPVTTKKPANQ
jgi:hypothetical protein